MEEDIKEFRHQTLFGRIFGGGFVSSSSFQAREREMERGCVSLILLFHQDRCLHFRQTTVDFCLPKLSIFHINEVRKSFSAITEKGLWL